MIPRSKRSPRCAEHNPSNGVVQRAEQSDVAAFLQSQLQQGLTPIANASSIRPFNGVYTTVEEMLTAHAMQPGQRGRAHVVTAANRMLGGSLPFNVKVPHATQRMYREGKDFVMQNTKAAFWAFETVTCLALMAPGNPVYITKPNSNANSPQVAGWWDLVVEAHIETHKKSEKGQTIKLQHPTVCLFNTENDKGAAHNTIKEANAMLIEKQSDIRLCALDLEASFTIKKKVDPGTKTPWPAVFIILWSTHNDYAPMDILLDALGPSKVRPASFETKVFIETKNDPKYVATTDPTLTVKHPTYLNQVKLFGQRFVKVYEAQQNKAAIQLALGMPDVNRMDPLCELAGQKFAEDAKHQPLLQLQVTVWETVLLDYGNFKGSPAELWDKLVWAIDVHINTMDWSPVQRTRHREELILKVLKSECSSLKSACKKRENRITDLRTNQLRALESPEAAADPSVFTKLAELAKKQEQENKSLKEAEKKLEQANKLVEAMRTDHENMVDKLRDVIEKQESAIARHEHKEKQTERAKRRRLGP